MPVIELLRVSTTVTDLRRAETFYRAGFSFAPGDETVIDDPAWAQLMGLTAPSTIRCLRMHLGVQSVELVAFDPRGRPYPEKRASNDLWFQHIALVVESITAVFDRLEQLAISPISIGGPQQLPSNTGGVSAFKFRDPDGHPMELLHFPRDVGDATWHRQRGLGPFGYDHSAIVVEDVERSIAFYTNLLGFRVAGRSLNQGVEQDRLDGLTDCVVDVVTLEPAHVPTPHLELLHYRRPVGRSASLVFQTSDVASTRQVHRVDDLDAVTQRLRHAGVCFVSPAVQTLATGVRATSIRDPDGHMIILTD